MRASIMEIGSKKIEDLKYLREITFGGAQKGLEIKESEWPHSPIVAIPGFFNGYLKDGIKRKMVAEKIRGTLLNWGFFTDGVENPKYLKQIDKAVEKYPNAVILAYSTGGLSTLLWADKNNAWDRFSKIITIGSPFHGVKAPITGKLLSKTLRDMSPGSKLIKRILNIKPPSGPEPKVISVFSVNDEHSPNPEGMALNWPTVIMGDKNTRPLSHGDLQNHIQWLEPFLDLELGKLWESVVK